MEKSLWYSYLMFFYSHSDIVVKISAEQHEIQQINVPANGIFLYQHIDRKIFGPVKMRIRNMYKIVRKMKREG